MICNSSDIMIIANGITYVTGPVKLSAVSGVPAPVPAYATVRGVSLMAVKKTPYDRLSDVTQTAVDTVYKSMGIGRLVSKLV
jgi:hypothetical protein